MLGLHQCVIVRLLKELLLSVVRLCYHIRIFPLVTSCLGSRLLHWFHPSIEEVVIKDDVIVVLRNEAFEAVMLGEEPPHFGRGSVIGKLPRLHAF